MHNHHRRTPTDPGHGQPRSRTLHLIDLVNISQGDSTSHAAAATWREYDRTVSPAPLDAITVAVSKAHADALFSLPPGIRRLVGSNAAQELVDSVDTAWVADRFDRVVIASGNAVFAPCAGALRDAGVAVDLVVGAGMAAWRLYASCRSMTRLAYPRESAVPRRLVPFQAGTGSAPLTGSKSVAAGVRHTVLPAAS